jgi:hypothetical protein
LGAKAAERPAGYQQQCRHDGFEIAFHTAFLDMTMEAAFSCEPVLSWVKQRQTE